MGSPTVTTEASSLMVPAFYHCQQPYRMPQILASTIHPSPHFFFQDVFSVPSSVSCALEKKARDLSVYTQMPTCHTMPCHEDSPSRLAGTRHGHDVMCHINAQGIRSFAIPLPATKMGMTAPYSSDPGKPFALFLRIRLQLDSHKGGASIRTITELPQPGQFGVIRPN